MLQGVNPLWDWDALGNQFDEELLSICVEYSACTKHINQCEDANWSSYMVLSGGHGK